MVDANFGLFRLKKRSRLSARFSDRELYLFVSYQPGFHNVYHFKTKDYDADVDGWTGMITNYHNQKA
ncbi:hypothetical protein PO124_06150 [Bacillus licheniformis]|nr:hypothetical protein [Bacillus licheniformis]